MRKDKATVIYPELSYKIVGCLFEVYKLVGGNHQERFYQNALKKEFSDQKIKYKEQVFFPIEYKNKKIGRIFFDFLIDGKVVLELKTGSYFYKRNLEQILDYLKFSHLKLGILANYTRDGVKFYRVLNIK